MRIEEDLYNIFFKEYKVELNDVVFSLGAGEGEEIEYLSERVGPNGKVFAIEADLNIFNKLQQNISQYKNKNVIALNIAVVDFIGSAYVVDTGGIANYITLNEDEGYISTQCTTMDQIVADYGIDKIDYIKVNIEGAEVPFLKGFKESYSIVKKWCISCHDFTGVEDQKTFEFVTNFFKERDVNWRNYDSEYAYRKFYVYV